MSKNTKTYAATLTVALTAALSPSAIWGQAVCPGLANATACTIDNFTSSYGLVKAITTGFEEVSQPPPPATGSGIVGGTRSIVLTSGSGASNPFGQPTQVQTVPKSSTNPAPALAWSNGFGNLSLLQVYYGATRWGGAPMNLDLTQYNTDSNGRIRFTFAAAEAVGSFAVEVYYPDSYGSCFVGTNLEMTSFTVDFPFTSFGDDVNWGDITTILFEFEAGLGFPLGSPNLAVTDIEVINYTSSLPPPTYTCQPTQ